MQQLVLSLCTGAGLLDKAFKEQGFVVVSAGDIIYNIDGDMRNFKGIAGRFDGVIAGVPCQGFSDANRDRPGATDSCNLSYMLLQEFIRIANECDPSWYLLENVRNVPTIDMPNYNTQRLDVNQNWFEDISRLRHIQFGTKGDRLLHIDRKINRNKCDYAALASDDRSYRELLQLQGLDESIDFPDFTVKGKKKLIGNGVPLSMGRALAQEVKRVTGPTKKDVTAREANLFDFVLNESPSVTGPTPKVCACGCGREPKSSKATYYDASCRKRAQRERERDSA